jgi:hypothetical protein
MAICMLSVPLELIKSESWRSLGNLTRAPLVYKPHQASSREGATGRGNPLSAWPVSESLQLTQGRLQLPEIATLLYDRSSGNQA